MSDSVKTVKTSDDSPAASFEYYRRLAKNIVRDTQLVADPAQDKAVKGESEIYKVSWFCFLPHPTQLNSNLGKPYFPKKPHIAKHIASTA